MPVARNFFRVLCRSALVEWVDEEGVLDVVPAKLMVSEIRVEDVAVGMLFFFGEDQKPYTVGIRGKGSVLQ